MDWSSHFQAVSSGAEPTASFGTTLFGKYTLAELQSLVNGKDDEVANLAKYAAKASPAWQSDFKTLQADYAKARANAMAAIAGAKFSLFDDNLNPAGDEPYRALLSTLNSRWQAHDMTTDRVAILMSRLGAENIPVAPYTVRQPKSTDDATNWMVQHPAAYFVAEPAARIAQGAADVAQKAADWSKPIIIAAAVVAGMVGLVLVKTYLPPPPRQLGTH